MDMKINWARTLRTTAVATVLIIALLYAVLASIGAKGPVWSWACDDATLPPNPTLPAPG